MISEEQLEKMRFAALNHEGVDALADISEVIVCGKTPLERLESLLQQVNNPYYFKVGNTPVQITFNQNEAPLEEKLKAHFIALKQRA